MSRKGMRSLHTARTVSILMATMLSVCLLQVVAGPAQAYTCNQSVSRTETHRYGGVAKVTINFKADCSDGLTHWDGVLYDTLCDARAARVGLISPWTPIPGSPAFEWGATNGNGCGTSSSFGGSSNNPGAPAADLWVSACNFSCADWDTWDLLYN
jgi:hypothetical protein